MTIDNPQAFPETHVPPTVDAPGWQGCAGMTLRDYFAAAALQGILTFGHPVKCNGFEVTHEQAAYYAADAMLKHRLLK